MATMHPNLTLQTSPQKGDAPGPVQSQIPHRYQNRLVNFFNFSKLSLNMYSGLIIAYSIISIAECMGFIVLFASQSGKWL